MEHSIERPPTTIACNFIEAEMLEHSETCKKVVKICGFAPFSFYDCVPIFIFSLGETCTGESFMLPPWCCA